jgi:hypothetical protein
MTHRPPVFVRESNYDPNLATLRAAFRIALCAAAGFMSISAPRKYLEKQHLERGYAFPENSLAASLLFVTVHLKIV